MKVKIIKCIQSDAWYNNMFKVYPDNIYEVYDYDEIAYKLKFQPLYLPKTHCEIIDEPKKKRIFMNFDIEIAIEDKGNCRNQRIDCKKCFLGIHLYNTNVKDRLDDLCDKDIVHFCAMLINRYQKSSEDNL